MEDVDPDAVHPFNEPSGPTVPLPPKQKHGGDRPDVG